jgi:hypothetical protein
MPAVQREGGQRDGAPRAESAHACRLVELDRSTLRYQRKRPDDAPVRQRRGELAAERRRYGYRRLGRMLQRERSRDESQEALSSNTKSNSHHVGAGGASARWEPGRR